MSNKPGIGEKDKQEMEFKQIEALINIAKHKSFSKAAEASLLTQPTVSAYIGSLEKELGVTLIDRGGKESRLTKQGRIFYKYALDMINSREKAFAALMPDGRRLSGVLEIQASGTPGQYLVPKLLGAFQREHADVRYYVEQSDSRQVIHNILEQKSEIGFAGYLKNNGLAYDLICRDRSVLITPCEAHYLDMRGSDGGFDLSRLRSERLIWREDGSATRATFEQRYCERYGQKPEIIATINNIESIKQAVAAGLGVSILSAMAVSDDLLIFPEMTTGRRFATATGDGSAVPPFLVFELDDDAFDREFYFVYKKDATLSPVAAAFRSFSLKYFSHARS